MGHEDVTHFLTKLNGSSAPTSFDLGGSAHRSSSSLSSPSPGSGEFVSPADLFTTNGSFSAPASTHLDHAPLTMFEKHPRERYVAYDKRNLKNDILSSSMFEPTSDPSDWSPLFSSAPAPLQAAVVEEPTTASLVPQIEHRFTHEKRSAIVMEDSSAFQDSTKVENTKKLRRSSADTGSSVDLPPIVVKDPSDPVAVRRARNTEAARRSRARKNERITELEELVAELQAKNAMLESENSLLRKLHNLPAR